MSDREFTVEIRRALIIIMRACVRRFGMSWMDFLPESVTVSRLDVNQSVTRYLDVSETRPGS